MTGCKVRAVSLIVVKFELFLAVNYTMKVLKYLLAIWAAIAVYSLLSLFYGANGFSAYRELLSGKAMQEENIQKLGAINAELENTRSSLLYDPDTITVHARQLGYGYAEERFLRIVGLGKIQNPHSASGNIVLMPEPLFFSDRSIKICALFTGILLFALLSALEFFRTRD